MITFKCIQLADANLLRSSVDSMARSGKRYKPMYRAVVVQNVQQTPEEHLHSSGLIRQGKSMVMSIHMNRWSMSDLLTKYALAARSMDSSCKKLAIICEVEGVHAAFEGFPSRLLNG